MNNSRSIEDLVRFLTLRNVYVAKKTIQRYIRRTPLVYARRISRRLDAEIYLKLENLQVTRAFKVRGGVYYALVNREEAVSRGLITASTGNHAQSIAYAAGIIGAEATIVMPRGVPEEKIRAVEDLGAKVIFHGSIFEEAREYAEKLAREKSMLYVHPINEPILYLGVATLHLENLEDLPEADIIINPIGGGSSLSGAVIVFKTASRDTRIIGVQAEGARSFYLSWRLGKLMSTGRADTIAEGLATARAYELPFMFLRDKLDDVVLVSDKEILEATRILLMEEGIVAEPSGAAGVAAALKLGESIKGQKVIVTITGGNISRRLLEKLTA